MVRKRIENLTKRILGAGSGYYIRNSDTIFQLFSFYSDFSYFIKRVLMYRPIAGSILNLKILDWRHSRVNI